MYYLLGNLHPKFRSSLKSIQLLCVARNPIIVKYGIEEILRPVVESIQELEKVNKDVHACRLSSVLHKATRPCIVSCQQCVDIALEP